MDDTEDTASAGSDSDEPDSSGMLDEDTILFGSLTSNLSDALADEVEDAITAGVSSLPLLSTSQERADLFRSKMREQYLRNVDLWELYAGRNLFTVSMFPPRRRQRIVAAFLKLTSIDNTEADNNNDNITNQDGEGLDVENSSEKAKASISASESTSNNDNEDASPFDQSYEYPKKEEIPSAEDMKFVEEEMIELKAKIKSARLQRNKLLVEGSSAKVGGDISADVMRALKEVDTAMVQEKVKENIESVRALQGLVEEGKDVQQKLEDAKRERRDDEINDLEHLNVANAMNTRSKKRLGLEDQYKEDRKHIKTNLDDLVAFTKLLKKA